MKAEGRRQKGRAKTATRNAPQAHRNPQRASMDESLKSLLAVASGIGLGQMLLFWVTRRSHRADRRDEQELHLETSLLAERRELLASLRAQLDAEQSRGSRLESEKATLLGEIFSLQKFANEVLAKYDFLRTLNPDALLPAVHLEPARPLPGVCSPTVTHPPAALAPVSEPGRD